MVVQFGTIALVIKDEGTVCPSLHLRTRVALRVKVTHSACLIQANPVQFPRANIT